MASRINLWPFFAQQREPRAQGPSSIVTRSRTVREKKKPSSQAEPEQVQRCTVHSAWSIFGWTTHHFRPRSVCCSQWEGFKSTPDCRLGPTTKLVKLPAPVIPSPSPSPEPELTTLRLADAAADALGPAKFNAFPLTNHCASSPPILRPLMTMQRSAVLWWL